MREIIHSAEKYLRFVQILEGGASVSEWVQQEERLLDSFFGQSFDLTAFKKRLTTLEHKQLEQWALWELEPHYLPPIECSADSQFPGWLVKPGDYFWEKSQLSQLSRGISGGGVHIDRLSSILPGKAVLIDIRKKPNQLPRRIGGQQMYEHDDFLGPLIRELREQGTLSDCQLGGASESRFDISRKQWEEIVKPFIARRLGFSSESVRLERALEFNIIPQLYPHLPRGGDGTTTTSVLLEEYVDDSDHCLVGGSSSEGGLRSVRSIHANSISSSFGIRPIIELD